tara:strand:+ start:11076 stop:13202 length:2127 start_codon:yes stop_codon:yes gene_type:complete
MSDIGEELEQQVTINGKEYILRPNAKDFLKKVYEEEHEYGKLGANAKKRFSLKSECISTSLCSEHRKLIPSLVDSSLCHSIIEEFDNDPDGIKHPSVLETLLPLVLTEEVDRELISYFQSEYCIFWWSIYKVEDDMEDNAYFTKWHCDSGPQNHLKLIVYLNGYDEHKSCTGFLNKKTTDQLKDIGYIYNDINNRVLDISDLCKHYKISFSPEYSKPNTGDCLIFNPAQLAHKALSPSKGHTRYALNLCLVQSESSWQDVKDNYYFPIYGCKPFQEFGEKALRFKAMSTDERASAENCIEIPLGQELSNFHHVRYLLNSIFSSKSLAQTIINHLEKSDPNLLDCKNLSDLFRTCNNILQKQLTNEAVLNKVILQGLLDLANYESTYNDSYNRYNLDTKPKVSALFWPNPNHPERPNSKYQLLPYVNKQPIMDVNTPIGSAGSCFAFEIAKIFQQDGYNYVITERNDDPMSGMLIDGYQPGDDYVKFCANYGILFNTPSFMQLAEKAFGLKDFSKLLIENDNGYFMDPYRENVLFTSRKAYLDDYDKHTRAVRESFLQAEVFVITLGLNECWELYDGTVISRNPRQNMYQLVKHKTLTVSENVNNIQRFFEIIKSQNPNFKLIISVSPIPFLATGRANESHIIAANCHSKSVLRVAADELVSKNEDMYYLPSYELVTECIEEPWEADHRHVKADTVKKVVNMFKEIFVS